MISSRKDKAPYRVLISKRKIANNHLRIINKNRTAVVIFLSNPESRRFSKSANKQSHKLAYQLLPNSSKIHLPNRLNTITSKIIRTLPNYSLKTKASFYLSFQKVSLALKVNFRSIRCTLTF